MTACLKKQLLFMSAYSLPGLNFCNPFVTPQGTMISTLQKDRGTERLSSSPELQCGA